MAKMIGLGAMVLTMSGVSAPLAERPKKMSAPSIASSRRAHVRVDGMRRLPLVHALRAAAIDHALGVAQHDVARLEADRLDEIEAGDAGRAGAVADEPRGLDVAAGQLQGVDHAGGGDDRRAVLVVMEHRNVHQLAQPLLDDEAFRRLDVLEIDAAERRPEIAHALMNSSGILGVDLQIDRIDIGEALEQDRLALHHRLGGERPEIAEARESPCRW